MNRRQMSRKRPTLEGGCALSMIFLLFVAGSHRNENIAYMFRARFCTIHLHVFLHLSTSTSTCLERYIPLKGSRSNSGGSYEREPSPGISFWGSGEFEKV